MSDAILSLSFLHFKLYSFYSFCFFHLILVKVHLFASI